MVDEEARNSSPSNQPAKVLASWDDEGGFLRWAPAEDHDRQASLAEAEERMLQYLGAAVIARWNDLPTDVQRELFGHAVSVGDRSRTVEPKEQIARFLNGIIAFRQG
jgi:hypothetical protein